MKKSEFVTFTVMLFFVFLALKLSNHIDWSWLWVTSPLWIPPTVLLVFYALLYFWSKWYLSHKRKIDPKLDAYLKDLEREEKEQPRTLADRLKQMQEERARLENERIRCN